jgi:hypothetical protein
MSFALMSVVEILLFNLAFILIYQPSFIFHFLKLRTETERKIQHIMMIAGILVLCILFGWSFYFGATLFIYKQSLL